jgi:hypothetical protein
VDFNNKQPDLTSKKGGFREPTQQQFRFYKQNIGSQPLKVEAQPAKWRVNPIIF